MPKKKLQLEVWNSTNTQRLAIFGRLLAGERTEVLTGESVLTGVQVPLGDAAIAHLSDNSVLRLQRTGVADRSLWRLLAHGFARTQQEELVASLNAIELWTEFRHGHVRQAQTGGRPALLEFGLVDASPEDVLADYLIPSYEGTTVGFQVGIVDAAIAAKRVDIAFNGTSPLEGIRMLEAAAQCEARFRLDPTATFYYVDLLTRIGNEAGGPELRYRKNLLSIERVVDPTDVATRVRIRGSGELQMADATWAITNIAGNVLTLGTDAASSPVFADGALVGLRFWIIGRSTGSISWQVTASDAENRTITVAQPPFLTSAGVQVGDRGYFAHDATGLQRLDYLEDPVARAIYGVLLPKPIAADDVPDAINLLVNSDLSTWPVNANGWGIVNGATVTQSTDPLYVRHGSSAARVQASAAGQGLSQTGIAITSDSRRPYHAVVVGLTVISGLVRVQLTNVATGISYPQSQRPIVTPAEAGGYLEIGKAGPLADDPLPAGTYRLDVTSYNGAAEFYADSAMVTHVVGNEIPEFTREPAPQVLWQRAARELLDRSTPRVEYRPDVVNLHGIDPDTFRFEQLRLGDDVKVRDPDIGRETQRIVEISTNILDESVVRCVVSPSPRHRVHDKYRPPAPSPNGRRGVVSGSALEKDKPAIQQHFARLGLDGLLYITAAGTARTASVQVRFRLNEADPWPASPNATINGRIGTVGGFVVVGGGMFYQLLPLDGTGNPGDALEGVFGTPTGAPGSLYEWLSWEIVHNSADGNTVEGFGYVGPAVTEVLVYEILLPQAPGANPFDEDDANYIEQPAFLTATLIPVDGRVAWTFSVPPENYIRYTRAVAYSLMPDASLRPASVKQDLTIIPKGAQPPVFELDDSEDGEKGYAWVRAQLRGIAITSVQVQTQIGRAPMSGLVAVLRGQGDASVVKGGTLGAHEYEHEVTLDADLQAWIYFLVTLAGGQKITIPFPGFDKNRVPNFVVEPIPVGTIIPIRGDAADTKSWRVERIGDPWMMEGNGRTADVDVAVADASANPGLEDETAAYLVTLFSDSLAYIDGTTLTATREVVVSEGSPPAGANLTVTLTDPVSSDVLTINVLSDSAPVGSYLEAVFRYRIGGGAWTELDITNLTDPVMDDLPLTTETYDYATGFPAIAKDLTKPRLDVEVSVYARASGGGLMSKVDRSTSWYINEVA